MPRGLTRVTGSGAGLSRLQVRRGIFAALGVAGFLEGNALTFRERAHARALDRSRMHEDVLGAVIRLDEAITFGGVEPLNSSRSHMGDSPCRQE